MITLVGSVLAASLLGSLHCAGMCGGFVCFYSGTHTTGRVVPHVAYNLGRLLSYVTLGVLAGALGHGIDRLGAWTGIERGAAIISGSMMIVWGASTLARHSGMHLGRIGAPGWLPSPLAAALRAVRSRPPMVRALLVGLATTLLPCGWLWAFAATAAGTASAAWGAVVMAAFWLGTLPIMTSLGLAAQRAFGPLRSRLPALTAVALVVIGLLTITGKFHAPTTGARSAEHVNVCH